MCTVSNPGRIFIMFLSPPGRCHPSCQVSEDPGFRSPRQALRAGVTGKECGDEWEAAGEGSGEIHLRNDSLT